MSFWLLLICVVGIAKDGPVGLVVFYEQEVKDRAVELGLTTEEKIKKISAISGAAVFLPMIAVIPSDRFSDIGSDHSRNFTVDQRMKGPRFFVFSVFLILSGAKLGFT